MLARSEELFNELIQIYRQYKQEVPGHRQAWPQSIKDRIFELQRIGTAIGEISIRTGISSQTIYGWNYEAKKRQKGFLPVKVVDKPTTVTVREVAPVKGKKPKGIPTVTVITPTGYVVEGLQPEDLVLFFKALS